MEKAVAEMMDDELPADVPVIARARARVDTALKYGACVHPERWSPKRDGDTQVSITVVIADGVQSVAIAQRDNPVLRIRDNMLNSECGDNATVSDVDQVE